jgi:succinylarginine dihydrolase
MQEVNFDGLVGPTHNYGGLSAGNIASTTHGGRVSHPRRAALQGLEKMRFVRSLGLAQGVLPPHPRPSLPFLRSVGFAGKDEDVIAEAARVDGGRLLRVASSAAAMWTANAATVAPSADSTDGRVHLVPANLVAMPHRAIEASTTHAVLSAIFRDDALFCVHPPLPAVSALADEGAANHTRLVVDGTALHIFAWGRHGFPSAPGGDAALEPPAPKVYPARQTLEASQAVARALRLPAEATLFVRQSAAGIDAGAFHTDVLAVGSGHLLLVHAHAFHDVDGVLAAIRARLGDGFRAVVASDAELPVAEAVKAYPFNSQLLSIPPDQLEGRVGAAVEGQGAMVIVAPRECAAPGAPRDYLQRVLAADVGVEAVHTFDLKQSMQNGGGPACLRLRVPLEAREQAALSARVLVDDALDAELVRFVEKHYREALAPADVADPLLWRECQTALDELTQILRLGSVYDFQRAPR